jgi:hypothetical protein
MSPARQLLEMADAGASIEPGFVDFRNRNAKSRHTARAAEPNCGDHVDNATTSGSGALSAGSFGIPTFAPAGNATTAVANLLGKSGTS